MQQLIKAEITLSAEQLAALMAAMPTDRHEAMVRRLGEACTKTQAAKAISCSVPTINAMLADGRIMSACGGERVDVRSLADYIEDRGANDRAARQRRKGRTQYIV